MRKRSKYKPMAVIMDPLTFLRPASFEQKRSVMLCFLTALDCLASGKHPGIEEWRQLADCCNTIETLVQLGTLDADETMPIVNRSIEAMVLVSKRFREGKAMRIDGPGLQALRVVVDVYWQCLDQLTAREMAVAQQTTQRRMDLAMRSKTTNETVVML